MNNLDKLVNLTITRQPSGITRAGFGTPLILGENATDGEVNVYTSLTAVAEDFAVNDPEYLKAQRYFQQNPRAERVKIGYSSGDTTSGTITTEINDAIAIDKDWYFLDLVENDTSDAPGLERIQEAAEHIETMRRLFVHWSSNEDVKGSGSTDIASVLGALGLTRTAIIYNEGTDAYAASGLVGRCAPLDAGSETWANKSIVGITTSDNLTDSEIQNLDGKNVNYYLDVAGRGNTFNGKVVEGEYIDVIRFIDWLYARIQEEVFLTLSNSDKVPFTDAGISQVEATLRAVLKRGVRRGGLVEGSPIVNVPSASDISTADKQARELTGVTFSAQLAGAIHATDINGDLFK